jgi:glutathione synthase/RimK-type ligase-like ATP-grasp enzyme
VVDVVLVTGRRMPVPDPESHLLVSALHDLGLSALVRPWGAGFEWRDAPLVVVRTPWDYFDAREQFLGWARETAAVTALVNPVGVLEWNSHKGYLRELRGRGVPSVETTVVPHDAAADVRAAALEAHTGEVVVKPAVGGGAVGALRSRCTDAAARDHLSALTRVGDALVQPMASAVTTQGEVSLIYFGHNFSHAVRKIPAAGDYRVQVQYGGRVESYQPSRTELAVASAALACVPGDISYGRVDVVSVAGQPAVMELEVIDPQLFLADHPAAAQRFAEQLQHELRAVGQR